jgi:class 3 adenylate cyclase
MPGLVDRGALDALSLRFVDDELEGLYQYEGGAEGIGGLRIIIVATIIIWALAAIVVPLGTDVPVETALTVGGLMAVVGAGCLIVSRWADTMNHQHALASLLTSANGLVILLLAAAGGAMEGYAVGAIMLLFLFGFVSQTRFIYALVRTVVIGAGMAIAFFAYPGNLVVDVFFFLAAAAGSLVGLRMIERSRRRAWHQGLVISEQTASIVAEKAESERLLLNVLPASVSTRLKAGEHPIADNFSSVSVVFADVVGFTAMASVLSAEAVITLLSDLYSFFDELVTERGLEKIKTIGDSYMAVGGLPEPLPRHAELVVDLGLAMLGGTKPGGQFEGLELRVGIHSGPVAGGVIGSRKFAYDVWGDTVNMAARLQQTGVPGRVHVSEHTCELVEGAFRCEPRGVVDLHGLGEVATYLVIEPEAVPA